MATSDAPECVNIRVLGIDFRVASDTPRFLRELEGRFCCPADPGTSPLEISILSAGDRFRLGFEDREAHVTLSGAWPSIDDFIQLVIQREHPELSFVHGASIAGPAGAAILFGRSTAGKTTLALALAQTGYRLLAEDLTPLNMATGEIYPLQTKPQLRTYTSKLARKRRWNTTSPENFLAKTYPLKYLVHVSPHTSVRTGTIYRDAFDDWNKLLVASGLAEIGPKSATVSIPLSTDVDFNCEPEWAAVRSSEMARILLQHTYQIANRALPESLSEVARLMRDATCSRLRPGHLDATVSLVRYHLSGLNT